MRGAAKDARGVGTAANRAGIVGDAGMDRLGRSAQSAGIGFRHLAAGAAAYAGGRGIRGAITLGNEFNRTIDSQRIGFTTMLGTQAKAAAMMRDIQQLAADSPVLDPQSTGEAARRLMAFGVATKNVIPYTRALGDMAAATGQSIQEVLPMGARALGQIASKGKLQAEEMNQLAESVGLSRKRIRDELGMTAKEFEESFTPGNAISADRALPAIMRAMQKQSKGAAKMLSKTTAGEFDAARERLARTIGKATRPMYDEVGDIVGEVSKDLDHIWGRKDFTFGEKLAVSSATIKDRLRPVAATVGEFWRENDMGEKLSDAAETALTKTADAAARAAPKVAGAFVQSFLAAGPWTKVFAIGLLASKLGVFSTLGSMAAARFQAKWTAAKVGDALAGTTVGQMGSAMPGQIEKRKGRFQTAGRVAGRILGPALALAMVPFISDAIKDLFPDLERYSGSKGWGNLWRDITGQPDPGENVGDGLGALLPNLPGGRVPRNREPIGSRTPANQRDPSRAEPARRAPRARGASFPAPKSRIEVPVNLRGRELGRGVAELVADDFGRE